MRASHPFAALASMRGRLAPDPPPEAASEPDRWVESLVSAAHERFAVDEKGRILDTEGGRVLGHLTRGTTLLLPEVRLMDLDELGAGARSRILRRLVAFARDLTTALFAPLRADAARELSAAGRGIVYQIEQGLGTLDARGVKAQIASLTARDRELFAQLDVVIGGRVVYASALLKRGVVEQRAALYATFFDAQPRPALPRAGAVSTAAIPGVDPRAYVMIGYPVFGARAIRSDVAERVHRALVEQAGNEGEGESKGPSVAQLASLLGCPVREVPAITAELFPG
jgi:ATP-dependent RNA helicase SUPV3L1/SUV3